MQLVRLVDFVFLNSPTLSSYHTVDRFGCMAGVVLFIAPIISLCVKQSLCTLSIIDHNITVVVRMDFYLKLIS